MTTLNSFTIEAFTLLGIGLFFIALRTYVRLSTNGLSGFKADDYLMLVAAVAYSAETALAYSVGSYWHGLANNGLTDAERKALDPASEEYRLRVNGSKTQIAGWSTYTFLLWTLKASMCTFYLRLTDGLDYRARIYTGFGIICVTWLVVFLSILLGCRPMHKNWQIYPDPGNYCQPAISRIDIFVTVVLNVLTDIYLMSIPLPMLWKASLRPAKKIGLTLLFSGGIFVTMAGILRCVLIVTNPVTGAQQAGSWAVRETFVAVITSNAPMIFPQLRRWGMSTYYRMRGLTGSLSGGGPGRSGSGDTGAVFVLEDKNPRRGMGPRSVNPLPNMTFSESEEHIYNTEAQQQQQGRSHDSDTAAGALTAAATTAKTASSSLPRGHRDFATTTAPAKMAITKEVELHITEEENCRRSDSGSEESAMELTTAAMRAGIEGAQSGNYFLTQQQQQHPQKPKQQPLSTHSTRIGGLGGSENLPAETEVASPLGPKSWQSGSSGHHGGSHSHSSISYENRNNSSSISYENRNNSSSTNSSSAVMRKPSVR